MPRLTAFSRICTAFSCAMLAAAYEATATGGVIAEIQAASIAQENAVKIGLKAVKLGIAGFFIPFVFVLNLDFLQLGLDLKTVFTFLSAFVISNSLAIAIQGYIEKPISIFKRFLFLIPIVFSMQHNYALFIAGAAVFALLLFAKRKNSGI
jgi:TRAP-type uncharacterized transport system fused permease subunit